MIFALIAIAGLLGAPASAEPRPAVPAAPPALPEPTGVWLGVYLDDAADGGVQVLGLVPGGPAERGGLAAGDVLLQVNGEAVPDLATFNRTMRTMSPGQRAQLQFLRQGSRLERLVLLGDRRKMARVAAVAAAGAGAGEPPTYDDVAVRGVLLRDPLGMTCTEIPVELRRHYGAPPDAGVLVVRVEPGGPAASSGLRVGDVVVRAGTRAVEAGTDVTAALLGADGIEVPLEVVRAHKAVRVSVPRPALPQGRALVRKAGTTAALEVEVERLRARVAELEAELEKARRE